MMRGGGASSKTAGHHGHGQSVGGAPGRWGAWAWDQPCPRRPCSACQACWNKTAPCFPAGLDFFQMEDKCILICSNLT